MNKLGVFDTIVGGITRRIGSHIYPVLLATMLVSICSHLDGQAPSTILVTIPALYPFYKKLRIRPVVLTFILSAVVGIWSFLPWGSVTLTNSVVMGLDVLDIWQELLPALLCMTGILSLVLLGTAYTEKKRIAAGLNDKTAYGSMFQSSGEELPARARRLLPFNTVLTVAVLILLFLNVVNTAVVFMAGYTVAVLVNYRTIKEQMAHFSEHASTALMICLAMVLGGVFGNVLNDSGVLNAMITALVSVFPQSWSRYLLTIFGTLSYPLGCFLGLTAYSFGVTPVINGVAANFGFSALQSVCALAPGYSMSIMACPIMPSTPFGAWPVLQACGQDAFFLRTAALPFWRFAIGFSFGSKSRYPYLPRYVLCTQSVIPCRFHLMRIRISLPVLVLCGKRGGKDRGIYNGTLLQKKSFANSCS